MTECALSYCGTLERLFALNRFGEKLGLEAPRALEAALGHPLKRYRSVLIGGTNGKGSTAAMLEAILRAQGLKVGLFTSPHLMSFTERVRIDGVDWSENDVVDAAWPILELAKTLEFTFFEASWAMAARAFADAEVDVAIFEVGLGGRLDATNVAEPEVSAITHIGLDHTAILGETLEAIAHEKSAIFRSGRPALTAASGTGLEALKGVSPAHLEVVAPVSMDSKLPLPGAHQARNAGLALAIAKALGHPGRVEDLSLLRWAGRMETHGNLLLDCAHNPDAVDALLDYLSGTHPEPMDLIFGATVGKNLEAMARRLGPAFNGISIVSPNSPRACPVSDVEPYFSAWQPTAFETVEQALKARRADRTTLVCGSCYLVGEVRALLQGQAFPECGIRTTAR